MDRNLAPRYQYKFGDYWVLWYASSNSYSTVDSQFKKFLDLYLESESEADFSAKLQLDKEDPKELITTFHTYLKACNAVSESNDEDAKPITITKRSIVKYYAYNNKLFKIYYDSELVQKAIHPSLAHLEIETNEKPNIFFDIYLKGDHIYLYKNENFVCSFPKHEYHKLQGKFNIELLNFIHGKTELDWIATLHGSTITDGNSSILCIGESGKGKSTLCAILASNGFKLVADDVSALSSNTLHFYTNPAAVSVKKGAFELLKPIVKQFSAISTIHLNKTKGIVKYVPFNPPFKHHFPCKTIILVNYKKSADTALDKISISSVLQTLIPDSWLSPYPKHAKQFLDWLTSANFYQLTYSSTQSVVKEVSALFQTQKNTNINNSK